MVNFEGLGVFHFLIWVLVTQVFPFMKIISLYNFDVYTSLIYVIFQLNRSLKKKRKQTPDGHDTGSLCPHAAYILQGTNK